MTDVSSSTWTLSKTELSVPHSSRIFGFELSTPTSHTKPILGCRLPLEALKEVILGRDMNDNFEEKIRGGIGKRTPIYKTKLHTRNYNLDRYRISEEA